MTVWADLTDITLRRSSKIPTLLANPCSPCIHATYDIVLHLVVSDFAAWSFLALTDYLQFLIPLSLFFLVDVGVDPYLKFPVVLSVRLLSSDPFSIFLLKKKKKYILDNKFDWISVMVWVCAWVCNGVCLCLYVYVCVLFEIYSPKCPSTHFKDWKSRNYEDNSFLYKTIVRAFLINIYAYFSSFPSTVSIFYVIYKTTWCMHRLYAYWEGLTVFCFVTIRVITKLQVKWVV